MTLDRIMLYRMTQNHYQLIKAAIDQLGFHTRSFDFVDTRHEAFDQCRKFVPQVIFLGWEGEDDTIAFLNNIRQDLRSPDRSLPTIILSSLCSYADVYRACEVNITDYIILPIEPEAFTSRIHQTFRRCGFLQEPVVVCMNSSLE